MWAGIATQNSVRQRDHTFPGFWMTESRLLAKRSITSRDRLARNLCSGANVSCTSEACLRSQHGGTGKAHWRRPLRAPQGSLRRAVATICIGTLRTSVGSTNRAASGFDTCTWHAPPDASSHSDQGESPAADAAVASGKSRAVSYFTL